MKPMLSLRESTLSDSTCRLAVGDWLPELNWGVVVFNLGRWPGFPSISIWPEVGDLACAAPTPGGVRSKHYSKPDVRLAVLIDPSRAGSLGMQRKKRRTADHNEVRPSVGMADGKNVHQRWRVIRNQQLCLWHAIGGRITGLLLFRSGRLDLYPYDGFVASFDDEDIVANVHFGDGDIDPAMEQFGHHSQLTASAKKCEATAGLGILYRRCPGWTRRARKIRRVGTVGWW